MTVLLNLLPDVRQAKLRESRRRQLVGGVSVVIWIVCGAVVLLLALYAGGQKVIINNYTHSIASEEAQLKAVPGLIDAYTAEQHLESLPSLYNQRALITKFLQTYMEADPTDVVLTSMNVDSTNSLSIQGTGKSYASVAKLARALEASNVSVGTGAAASNTPNFSGVQMKSLSNSSKGVDFSMTVTMSSGVTSASQ